MRLQGVLLYGSDLAVIQRNAVVREPQPILPEDVGAALVCVACLHQRPLGELAVPRGLPATLGDSQRLGLVVDALKDRVLPDELQGLMHPDQLRRAERVRVARGGLSGRTFRCSLLLVLWRHPDT